MEPAPLLIVSHTFPPYRGIGGRRWVKFAKALAERGHAVHVIHSGGSDELKGSLWNADAAHPRIFPHALPQRYPTVLFKRPLVQLPEKLLYRFWKFVLPLVTKGNWLDKTILWQGQFLRKAGELIETHGIRHVIITGAPFRLFHFGVLLKEAYGVQLVCDLRDPWTWHDGYGHGSLGKKDQEHELALEKEMMEKADRITSPHRSVIDHLKKQYPQQAEKCSVLGHAIDPDELGLPQPPRNDGAFKMIYAGSLYGAHEAEAYFEELLKAFGRMRDNAVPPWPRITVDLYITGHGFDAYVRRVQETALQEHVRIHPPLPAQEVFACIAQADAVIIFIPSFNKDLLGTKFTEIFHLRRPVIHVGAPGAVSEAIVSRKLGVSLPVDRLAEELPRIVSGESTIEIDTTVDLSEHMLSKITDRLIAEVLI